MRDCAKRSTGRTPTKAAESADLQDMSLVKANRVTTPTAGRYFLVIQWFLAWHALVGIAHQYRDHLSLLMVKYLEELCLLPRREPR